MYTIETLKQLNPLYDSQHRVRQSDADKANFGYTDVEAVKKIYVKDAMQIVAECIFEYYGSVEAHRIFIGSEEECRAFIQECI